MSSHVFAITRAAGLAGLMTRLGDAVATYWHGWRNRAAFRQLEEFSDAELADIGLTRLDLYLASSFGGDPTKHLRVLAEERAGPTAKDRPQAQ